MKISVDDILIKLVLLTPLAMLIQRVFDAANRILVGAILVVLIYSLMTKIKRSSFLIVSYAMVLFIYSFININNNYFTLNMVFYFPLWAFYLTYMTDNYEKFVVLIKRNLKFIRNVIYLWCLLVSVSIAFSSSYVDGVFQSFSNGAFRFAPTALFIGILIWVYSGITKNKKNLLLIFVPFISLAYTGTRTYTIIFLVLLLKVFYNYFAKKIYFYILLIPTVLLLLFVLSKTMFLTKFNSAIGNIHASDKLAALTSNRSVFWEGEFRLFLEAGWIDKLFGEGLTASYVKNMSISGQPIWAHNDFMEMLNCHGLIGIIFYVLFFLRFYSKAKKVLKLNFFQTAVVILVCFLNAFFNGLYVYITAALSIPFLMYATTFDFKFIKNPKKSAFQK